MGIIASRAVRTSQPQYPATIESSLPALDGVTASIIAYGPANNWRKNQGSLIASPTFNGAIAAGATPAGSALVFNGTNAYLDYGVANIPTNEFTLLWGGVFDANDSPRGFIDCTNNGVSGWNIYQGGGDTMYFNNSSYPAGNPSTGWTPGRFFHGALRNKYGGSCNWFRDGAKIYTGTGLGPIAAPTLPFWIGRLKVGGLPYLKGRFAYIYLLNKFLDDATITAIHGNPWLLFSAEEELILVSSGGGGVSLSSSAAANVTGSGALSVAVPIAGASAAIATGQGTLGIALPLSGASTSVVTGTATLNATQALAGSGLAGATGQGTLGIAQALTGSGAPSVAGTGTLSLAISLNSAALANVLGAGTLNGSVALAGAAAADVSGQGTVSLSLALSSTAIANAIGSANLGVNGALQGAGVASVNASATLNQAIPLQGASLTATNASGTLTQIVPIGASAVSLVSGQAALILNVSMAADALAQALAVGNMTLRVALSAAAVANVVATASFPHLPTPAWRTVTIPSEKRTWYIEDEDRTLRMSA
jgi:hypothetical protein